MISSLSQAAENLHEATASDEQMHTEVIADKGYHSNATLAELAQVGVRSYVSEPDRGRRKWKDRPQERDAVYANRRRIRRVHGKAMLRQRSELLERPFAHCCETGGMRRTHLKGHGNILKRLLILLTLNNAFRRLLRHPTVSAIPIGHAALKDLPVAA
ncbi:MAG: hypothetical protein O2923_13910 [Verrucomicrobia bacterium]|nr:hypothetical protein [Verrucomicrobiota bacterium]MDA1088613.1 hypothetical protein [Verrucomicrobiota bacterium]